MKRALQKAGQSFFLVATLLATVARGDLIAQYSFTATNLDVTLAHPNITAGSISNGGALSQCLVNASLAYSTTPVLQVNPSATSASTNVSASFASNNFFQFTITVDPGLTLSLSNLSFNVARGGSSSTRYTGVQTDLTGATNLMEFSIAAVRPTWLVTNLDLSAMPQLQNISGSVTFLFAVATPSSGNSLEFDDITLTGSVIPEPTSLWLTATALLALCVWHTRRTN